MEVLGKAVGLQKDYESGKWRLSFEVDGEVAEEYQYLSQQKKLRIKAVKYSRNRSKDANAMMWACLQDLAPILKTDKWSLYLEELKKYGKYETVLVQPQSVEALKSQWRECEVMGDYTFYTKKGTPQNVVIVHCYYGSHLLDTKEFSTLLDGIISDMKEQGITPPPSEEIQHSLELWEQQWQRRHQDEVGSSG